MVKMLLNLKLGTKCITLEFPLARMDVFRTAVRSDTFLDCV